MINSMQPLISGTGATERSPLVEQLARKADGNRDGQVTSAEFSAFLSSLMQSLDQEVASNQESGATASGSAASEPSPVQVHAPIVEAGALTRAQGAALLRQAFDTVTRSR